MKRVVIGLSGGVDSSVAAYLLLRQGYEVIGLFMRNWHDESVTLSNECPWIDDANDALLVAQHLGIPFQVVDLSKQYKERIVDYMFREYEAGRTPNPDVLCNREIKFDVFLKEALALGADFVATGHYCRKIVHPDGRHGLMVGVDKNKDQSYFLCQVSQTQLQRALFPIGDLTKAEVRAIAAEQGLLTANKKDSQGLCFVGKISLPTFLQQQLLPKQGPIVEIPNDLPQFKAYQNLPNELDLVEELSAPFVYEPSMGKPVETHQGAHYYTIGQRKGLHIGGRPEPSFVLATDTLNNVIYSGQTDQHPGLYRRALKLSKKPINWIQHIPEAELQQGVKFELRIRYRQALQEGVLMLKNGNLYVLFEKMQRGVTPGQFAAWYLNKELIGSGVIEA
ncbi:MAG: tRNA 2-thiouridine(34) synthase MnmA [Bacteroidetes bacterium]|nr:tRNA 2-thiouridine(34) synthase MnmA [Bacteroidota bacterium]MBM3424671.1 tRNA 2-thiouridine(34) synthase MnmA [Bacteroidota bacterium]